MKSIARVSLLALITCAILLPATSQVNSPVRYPTNIADGAGPTPPPPPPGNFTGNSMASGVVLIADGAGPTPPPPPPGNFTGNSTASGVILIADGAGPTPPPPPPGNNLIALAVDRVIA